MEKEIFSSHQSLFRCHQVLEEEGQTSQFQVQGCDCLGECGYGPNLVSILYCMMQRESCNPIEKKIYRYSLLFVLYSFFIRWWTTSSSTMSAVATPFSMHLVFQAATNQLVSSSNNRNHPLSPTAVSTTLCSLHVIIETGSWLCESSSYYSTTTITLLLCCCFYQPMRSTVLHE